MGGVILEFSADKYFDAGKAKGKTEGEAIGEARGEVKGEQKLENLVNVLIADGKTDEVARAASDKDYRDSLYKKYAIA